MSERVWSSTRRGAWAGRGFHYQHLFTVLILVRQWAGLAPTGFVVPEGLEDCVIELSDRNLWVQIKSRKAGSFGSSEVESILDATSQKARALKSATAVRVVLGLEQRCDSYPERAIDHLFLQDSSPVVVCHEPGEETLRLLRERLEVADVLAEGLLSDLYRLVADTSASNASVTFDNRKRISTTDIERRVFERLEAEDPSAINEALTSRAIEPVDFVTPITEPGFYQGVKTHPGHIAAGLVLDRPNEVEAARNSLKHKRQLLISGPSGSGKSALLWLAAKALSQELRWFQAGPRSGPQDADAILRFVRARRPNPESPIGIVIDEVGAPRSGLWDILARELRGTSDVYLLGSIRREDRALLSLLSEAEVIDVGLDEALAQRFWEELRAREQTSWEHWREPFEESEGLMLEYVHILTQGQRLGVLVGEQVRQREQEGRTDELAILRATSVLCVLGGEVRFHALMDNMGIDAEGARRALTRLLDEHLVRESSPGIIGGLHGLRSKALSAASHDEVSYLRNDSLWRFIEVVTPETMPHVIHALLFSDQPGVSHEDVLRNLAAVLAGDSSFELWVAVLTGLGLGTLEQRVSCLIEQLDGEGVQRAQWMVASMFGDDSINIPELPTFPQWEGLRAAVLGYRAQHKGDLRQACLDMLPPNVKTPLCEDVSKANRLLACSAPILGGDPIRLPLNLSLPSDSEHEVKSIIGLLSTAYFLGPDVARDLASSLGGEEALLSSLHSQTPWLGVPVFEEGEHGLTVRANWYVVSDKRQPDPHETICKVCEDLIALCPRADAAACDAVDPGGQKIVVGSYSPWSKNIPRENLPAKSRIAWNVAFRQIMLARARTGDLTSYTAQMCELVKRTEDVLRTFTEMWISARRIANADALAREIESIVEQVNDLAYATPETPSTNMAAPVARSREDEALGALLTGVLGNLIQRISKIPAETAKGAAAFSGSLANQAIEHANSAIWRTINSPPVYELESMANRLTDIASILHEMAHDGSPDFMRSLVKKAKKATLGNRVRAAALLCRSRAKERLGARMNAVEVALREAGWSAKCYARPTGELDSVYWPACEIAILVAISDFASDARYTEETLSIGQQHLGSDWRYRCAPVVNGQVVAGLALIPSSEGALPDERFAEEWKDFVDLPVASTDTSDAFDQALEACHAVSAIVNCRDLSQLHPREAEVLDAAQQTFQENYEAVKTAAQESQQDIFEWALSFLEEAWTQVTGELEDRRRGDPVHDPICLVGYRAFAGSEEERMSQIAGARMLLRQAECQAALPGDA